MRFRNEKFSGPPDLRYIEHGSTRLPNLLLLHGVTRCAADFQPLFEFLQPHWRIIALNQRGHGGSQFAKSYLVTDYVADAVRLVQHMSQDIVVFGHSLGAMVAAAVAAQVPQRVHAVVLEDPPFHSMGRNIAGSAWEAQFRGMLAAISRHSDVEALTDALAEIALPGPEGSSVRLGELRPRSALSWSAKCLAQIDPQVLRPIIEGQWLDGFDPVEVAQCIQCPVTLLQADPIAGGALSHEEASQFRQAACRCQFEFFEGNGHLLHWQQPERIAQLLGRMLPLG